MSAASDFIYTVCRECGHEFGMKKTFWDTRADNAGKTISCPNGHVFPVTNLTPKERAWQEEIATLKARVKELEEQVRVLTSGAVSIVGG